MNWGAGSVPSSPAIPTLILLTHLFFIAYLCATDRVLVMMLVHFECYSTVSVVSSSEIIVKTAASEFNCIALYCDCV